MKILAHATVTFTDERRKPAVLPYIVYAPSVAAARDYKLAFIENSVDGLLSYHVSPDQISSISVTMRDASYDCGQGSYVKTERVLRASTGHSAEIQRRSAPGYQYFFWVCRSPRGEPYVNATGDSMSEIDAARDARARLEACVRQFFNGEIVIEEDS